MGTNRRKTPRVVPTGVPKRESNEDLPSILVRCRAEAKLSLEEVGKAVGISKKAVSNIELGRSVPRRTTRLLLEQFLRARGCYPKAAA